MVNYLLHYITIPLKVIGITILALVHRVILALRYPYFSQNRLPDLDSLRVGYRATTLDVRNHLIEGPYGTPILKINPDHQCLRHGSLAWGLPTKDLLDGMENFIVDDVIVRGFYQINPLEICRYGAAAEMPLSLAHGVATAIKEGVILSNSFQERYLKAVDRLMESDMTLDHDTSCVPRLKSTGFDALFALSLLYTAWQLSYDKKYLTMANKILWVYGYWLLLLAPMTHITPKNRRYFIDHMSMLGLRTAYLSCPNIIVGWLLKHALKFVHSQSYAYANPYFGALAYECGALPERQRTKILDLHAKTNILEAARNRSVIYTGIVPYDWSTTNADEFMFDDLQSHGIDIEGGYISQVPQNGLVLARSLAILMDEKI